MMTSPVSVESPVTVIVVNVAEPIVDAIDSLTHSPLLALFGTMYV